MYCYILWFPYLTNYELRKEFNNGAMVVACLDNKLISDKPV